MSFSFKFSADGSEFTRGLSKMKGEVKHFAKSAAGIMAGAFLGGKALGALQGMVAESKELAQQAKLFSTSTQIIQKFGEAAKASNFTLENMADAMHDMTEKAQDAAQGNKTYAESFAMMGLSAEDFINMNFEEKVRAFGDGLKYASKSGREFLAANELAGGAAQEMIGTFKDGGDAFFKLAESMNAATDAQIKAALKVDQAWRAVSNELRGLMSIIIGLFEDAGAGAAIMAVVVVESLKLIGKQTTALMNLSYSAGRLDFGGVKAALKEMEEASARSKAKILADIAGIHAAKDRKTKTGGATGSPSKAGGGSADDDGGLKGREDRLKKIAKIEKEIADGKKKAEFDALRLEGQRQQLMTERIEAAMKLKWQINSTDFNPDHFESDDYLKELELKKKIIEIDKKIAGVLSKKNAEQLKIDAATSASKGLAKEKAEQEQNERNSEMSGLQRGGVESGVISSSLRSIGGGGNAVVTRDPALQIAKRSERILEIIAANTAAVTAENEGKGGQKEY